MGKKIKEVFVLNKNTRDEILNEKKQNKAASNKLKPFKEEPPEPTVGKRKRSASTEVKNKKLKATTKKVESIKDQSQCTECQLWFDQSEFRRHNKLPHDHPCDIDQCNYRLDSEQNLKKHQKEVHGRGASSKDFIFVCEVCSRQLKTKRAWNAHAAKKHPYECQLCNKMFIEQKELEAHMVKNHGIKKEILTETEPEPSSPMMNIEDNLEDELEPQHGIKPRSRRKRASSGSKKLKSLKKENKAAEDKLVPKIEMKETPKSKQETVPKKAAVKKIKKEVFKVKKEVIDHSPPPASSSQKATLKKVKKEVVSEAKPPAQVHVLFKKCFVSLKSCTGLASSNLFYLHTLNPLADNIDVKKLKHDKFLLLQRH